MSEGTHALFVVPPPDPSIMQTTQILGLSRRKIYRLVEAGQLVSYVLGGKRRVSLASIKFYIDQCRVAGSQLSIPPVTGKRKPGRPRKHPKPVPGAAE